MRGWLRWAAATAALWTAVGLVFALSKLSGAAAVWPSVLTSLAQWWSWGLLSPVIIAIDRRLPFSSQQLARRVAAHAALGPALTLVYVYVFAALTAALGLAPWARLVGRELLVEASQGLFVWSLLVYYLITGVWQASRYRDRYLSAELRMQRLERSFAEARLNALRMQLDPHFLFNALNTISSQLGHDPKLARRMIEHLGDLLRLSLDPGRRQAIPLADELASLDHYLAIQKIRFGDKLAVVIRVDAGMEHALVPSMVVQPLVENAIRHGLSPRATGGTVTLTVARRGDRTVVTLLDDGVGLPAGWSAERSEGVGLSVTRERIAGLHPEGASEFSVSRRAEGGTCVALAFPFRLAGPP
jgi:hypothetical protein